MKTFWIVCVSIFCVLVMLTTPFTAAAKPIKVLFPSSMTGRMAAIGQFCRQGTQLAVDEINAAGGLKGRPIKLIMEDTKSNVPGAVNAMHKLLAANPDADAIFAGVMSHFVLAWDPLIRKAGLPTFTGAQNVKITAQGNPWIFRTRPNDKTQTELLVKYLVEKMEAKKIGIFCVTNEYGKGGMENITAALNKRGMEPAIVEEHNAGDKDFTPQFMKFQKAQIDVLVVWNHAVESALTIRLWHQFGRPFKMIGCPGFPPTQPVWSMVKKAAEGVQATVDNVLTEESPKRILDVASRYKAKYKKNFNIVVGFGYDTIQILAQVINKAGTDPEKMRQYLHKGTFKGLLTDYDFDEKGDGGWQVSISQIRNGKAVEVQRMHLR